MRIGSGDPDCGIGECAGAARAAYGRAEREAGRPARGARRAQAHPRYAAPSLVRGRRTDARSALPDGPRAGRGRGTGAMRVARRNPTPATLPPPGFRGERGAERGRRGVRGVGRAQHQRCVRSGGVYGYLHACSHENFASILSPIERAGSILQCALFVAWGWDAGQQASASGTFLARMFCARPLPGYAAPSPARGRARGGVPVCGSDMGIRIAELENARGSTRAAYGRAERGAGRPARNPSPVPPPRISGRAERGAGWPDAGRRSREARAARASPPPLRCPLPGAREVGFRFAARDRRAQRGGSRAMRDDAKRPQPRRVRRSRLPKPRGAGRGREGAECRGGGREGRGV